jgi:magnesium-protoporphyrin O-methyltransferase
MQNASYTERRGKLEAYFDRTAAVAWQRLTSDAPVSGIRATVRAGREEMRNTLLSWLPEDMTGLRILDAGCGTGALASEAAMRGGEVVAVDLSPTLIACARERALEIGGPQPEFHAGDMGLDHVLHRIAAAAAHANDFDKGSLVEDFFFDEFNSHVRLLM